MTSKRDRVVAIVQARMGSTRLPGKAMLSLACRPIIQHVIRRAGRAKAVDEVIVATTETDPDNVIERYARKEGAPVIRGDEEDVLGRMHAAVIKTGADLVVRVTADNPLLSPDVLDAAVGKARSEDIDYVSNKINRTFPAGLDVEVFTAESFERVEEACENPYYREHVTPYYREFDAFSRRNIASDEVFEDDAYRDRTDLRLTLDTPADYELFERIYNNVESEEVLDVRDAIQYVDDAGIGSLNIE